MNCPKCGSPLRASKKKEDYFLCDTCRTRMSLEYINTHTENKQKKKLHPLFLILPLLLIGCVFLFLHFHLYGKIKTMISPSKPNAPLSESIDFHLLDYEIITDNISPNPSYAHEYLLVNVEISNHSSETLTVDIMQNFEGYVDNMKIPYCAHSERVIKNLGYNPLDTELPSNESASGYLCFELPDSWQALEIRYAPVIWSSTDLTLPSNINFLTKKRILLQGFFLMPQTGIEPVREYKSRRILSPVRLPVPPLRHM